MLHLGWDGVGKLIWLCKKWRNNLIESVRVDRATIQASAQLLKIFAVSKCQYQFDIDG